MNVPANSDRAALERGVSAQPEEAAKPSSNRTFGLVFAVFFALVALLPLLRGHARAPLGLACQRSLLCSPRWPRRKFSRP